ncbi:hypothetical protein [Cryobacterium sp. PH29-G1]|uniref:hypothetical protein n=1 Tax=Cryobacterium sp. PH29-G1 TaxID=3046211 RepID=UPI0024BA7138|nr:hypothetical protein [Cryobacterium sp. PH29-G1]MDJ0349214.1 hypothetical protein [Cryobacterium sp. PH29-G1]
MGGQLSKSWRARECVPGGGDGLTQDGLTQDGLTQDGLTQDGLTQDGPTQDGPTQDGQIHGGRTDDSQHGSVAQRPPTVIRYPQQRFVR